MIHIVIYFQNWMSIQQKENHFFHIHQIYFHFLFFQNSENKSLKNDALTKLHSSYLFPKKYMRQLKVFFLDFCGWTSVTCLARIYIFFQWHTNSVDRKLCVFLSISWNLTVFRLFCIPPHNLAYGIGKPVMHNSIYYFMNI